MAIETGETLLKTAKATAYKNHNVHNEEDFEGIEDEEPLTTEEMFLNENDFSLPDELHYYHIESRDR